MFSCEYYKIFKNTYFEKHLQMTASVNSRSTIFQESLALPFKCLNFWSSHILIWLAFFFAVLTVGPFFRTQYIMVGFCSRSSCPHIICKKVFLEILQNSQEKTCARVSFLIFFFQKETLAHVFYCEFCEIPKNIFFTEHFWWLLLWFILVSSILTNWVSWT